MTLIQVNPLGYFNTYFYNHAHRPRLEKLLYIEPSRSSNGLFEPLLDPGGGLTSRIRRAEVEVKVPIFSRNITRYTVRGYIYI